MKLLFRQHKAGIKVRWAVAANPLGNDHPPLWEVVPPDGPGGTR